MKLGESNYLHEEERAALALFKRRCPSLAGHPALSEKELLIFLFARKLDISRTAALIKKHLKWRINHDLMRPLSRTEVPATLMEDG